MPKKIFTFGFILLGTLGVTYVLYLFNERSLLGVDDANIYFVYMRNLSRGEGFVYNAGGERVEGFTSLLWCLLGAACFKLSYRPEVLLLGANLLLVSFALWHLTRFADAYFEDRRWLSPFTVFLLSALFLFPGYYEWTVLSLLETGLWSTLLILGFINLLRWETAGSRPQKLTWGLSILLLFLTLTRPESLVWGSVFVAIRCVQVYRLSAERRRMGFALLPLSVFTGTAAGLIGWRLWYFGYPFPNTYYAKVSQDMEYNLQQGGLYLWDFVRHINPFLWTVPVVLLFYAIKAKKNRQNGIPYILLIGLSVTLALPLYAGGDHFGLGRLMQPTLPLIYLSVAVFAYGIVESSSALRKGAYVIILTVLPVFTLLPARDRWLNTLQTGHGPIRMGFVIAKFDRRFGEQLSRFFEDMPEYPSQGVVTAGGNAYGYKGKTIDLLGLNNVAMAHSDRVKTRDLLSGHASFNKDVFYAQHPDLLWMSPVHFISVNDTATAEPPECFPEFQYDLINRVLKGLAFDPLFRQTYYPVYIYKSGEPECVFAYAHTNFLKRLPQPPYRYGLLPRLP